MGTKAGLVTHTVQIYLRLETHKAGVIFFFSFLFDYYIIIFIWQHFMWLFIEHCVLFHGADDLIRPLSKVKLEPRSCYNSTK